VSNDATKAFIDVWTSIQANQMFKPNKIPQLQSMIDYWADPSYVASIGETATLVDTWFRQREESLEGARAVFLETLARERAFWASVDGWNDS
jgi:thiaminase